MGHMRNELLAKNEIQSGCTESSEDRMVFTVQVEAVFNIQGEIDIFPPFNEIVMRHPNQTCNLARKETGVLNESAHDVHFTTGQLLKPRVRCVDPAAPAGH